MFITFLWHDTNIVSHTISIIGAISLLLTFISFIRVVLSLVVEFKSLHPIVRFIIFLSMSFFAIKLLLQSFTIIHSINILVFGNRPAIMGFLHMVFLGFVTLFILGYMAQKNLLNIRIFFTRVALILFTIAILINEALLITQGMGTIFITGTAIYQWLLWYAGILLLAGSIFIGISRYLSLAKRGQIVS